MSRLACSECGTEPRPIGAPEWAVWWERHWTECRGVTLDAGTLANLHYDRTNSHKLVQVPRVGHAEPSPITPRGTQ